MKKKTDSHTIEISNKDKILFPKSKITKLDLVDYYEKISPLLLPHLRNRPIVMQRFPDGIHSSGFYQKNVSDYFPKWISTIKLRKKDGSVRHVLCQDKSTLLYIVNQACITPHIWLSKKGNIRKPDKLLFDLDPPSNDFGLVSYGAKKINTLLDELELNSFVMTTGSRGLHVVVPIIPKHDFDTVRTFAKNIGDYLEKTNKKLTTQTRKNKRKGRLFIDYLRNSYGQNSVAPYSIRAIEGAPVATPLEWDELNRKKINSQYYTIKNIFKRLKQKPDPWKDIGKKSKSIILARKKLDKMISKLT
ncbi:MAG: non-homologous end-joining DNA ligase [Nitrosopumilaceae archaeon]|nr:non-homologous end-joining DNA ligase [Nitrosopumilaceae archaeon]